MGEPDWMKSKPLGTLKVSEFQGDYRFLSNFFHRIDLLKIDGLVFDSVEHFYQWNKCAYGSDRDKIRGASTPAIAKRLGIKVRMIDYWDTIRKAVMRRGVMAKFVQNRGLARKLINTGNMVLEEGNRWNDDYWGIVIGTGMGENHLGKILMDVRSVINTMKEAF